METVFVLENLDCANCAAELERSMTKVSGVQSCKISFLTLKMWIESEQMTEDLVKSIQKTAKKTHGVKARLK